ncbi:unnamed protein product [Miscanthus lutarioriparius]|uniref:NAC domain-containing protein n=1 Tax=Miscanthus lutarioriparius TaxID=422564 RepID=A0A811QBV9_9POAL|nr:unnamed protein product [Miscanthus lutarioriparius]
MDESLLFGMAKKHANLYQHDDPWDLPPYFLLRKNNWKSLRTHSGYWKEKEGELTAIRSAGESSSSSSSASPSYVGVRKTLEFYLKDGTRGGEGTKTDWIIHEYHHLREDDDGEALFLQEDVVFRKVFKKCKNRTDHASSLYRQVESCVKALIRMSRTSEWLHEDLGVHCGPHGKSDNVWKHFTKIRSANEVYAACHRCDKVLKAHPKKHGTSHLKRHILTCSSTCTNPSTDEDREMLHLLRTALDNPYEQQKIDVKLDCQEDLTQLDPWDLNLTCPTPWYVTRSSNRQTQGGHWKEINKEFTAIRMDQKGCWKHIDKEIAAIQMVPVPQYMGLRRTLEFHHQDGRKMNWIMLEYQQLDDIQSPALFLQGDTVIRKVFRYDKDAVSSAFIELDRWLNGDDDDDEGHSNGEGVNTDTTTPSDYMDTPCSVFTLGEGTNTETATSSSDYMDTPIDRKRKRTGAASCRKSEVWMHFTKIHDTDCAVVYVVCHSCDRGYGSGRSTNGTSHLWRHNKSCTSKRRRTGNANDATTEWEAEIWPLFLLLKNYGGCDLSLVFVSTQAQPFSLFSMFVSIIHTTNTCSLFQKQSSRDVLKLGAKEMGLPADDC